MAKKNSAVLSALAVIGLIGAAAGGSLLRERLEFGKGGSSLKLAAGQDGSKLVASMSQDGQEADPDVLYYRVQGLLEEMFVEPVTDKEKLAHGGIKGMVSSLADPNAVYFDKIQFAGYKKALSGEVEGIGAELAYKYDEDALRKYVAARRKWFEEKRGGKTPKPLDVDMSTLVPDVKVVAVHPGSAAEKAGLKPGDLIEEVDGKTVVSGRFRRSLDALMKEIRANKLSDEKAKALVKEFDGKAKNSIPPARALEKLTSGTEGKVRVTWLRGTQGSEKLKGECERSALAVPAITLGGESTTVRFWAGAAKEFAKALEGGVTTVDLRNVPNGSYADLQACLALVLEPGEYGFIANARKKTTLPFKVQGSPILKGELTLLVDHQTPSYPAIFAMALRKAGKAKLVGELDPKLHPAIVEVEEVQGGAGYLLPIGDYHAEVQK